MRGHFTHSRARDHVAAEEGVWVRDIVAAIARRYGVAKEPYVRSIADVVAEHGDWAAGPAIDQQMSSDKIRKVLGWSPKRTDVLAEIS